jgi:hypothetical protein
MVNKLTSVNVLLAKIVRDLGLGDKEIRYQDFIEWIAEGLKFIGSFYQFEQKEGYIPIENYKGVLPCDFHRPLRYLGGCDFGNKFEAPYWDLIEQILDVTKLNTTTQEFERVDPYTFQQLQLVHYEKTSSWKSFHNNLVRATNLMDGGKTFTGDSRSYQINFDVVTTSFRYGLIQVRYLAMPIDENGYPMIPDDVAFMEALMWRVKAKLAMRKNNYDEFEACNFYWNKYCMQARGSANFPDLETMQRIANIRNRLVHNRHEFYEDFNNLGRPEIMNLHGSN